MADKESFRVVMDLLAGLSDEEIRADGIEALRRWRKKPRPMPPHPYGPGFAAPTPPPDPLGEPVRDVFSMHGDLGIELIKILAQRKALQDPDTHRLKEVFIDGDAMQREWAQGVLEFVWWLVRAGLAVEQQREAGGYPVLLRLTRRGGQLVDGSDDNPLLPGFLDRIQARCSGLPDGVVTLLADARACLDHTLLRPAVVLLGVAYELAIENVIDVLVAKNLLVQNTADQKAAERIRRIKTLLATPAVNTVLASLEARTAAIAAYDFADALRKRRNDAAHTTPTIDFDHEGETEEFLVSAGRHLPALWSLAL